MPASGSKPAPTTSVGRFSTRGVGNISFHCRVRKPFSSRAEARFVRAAPEGSPRTMAMRRRPSRVALAATL
jgi:hypothetical protein